MLGLLGGGALTAHAQVSLIGGSSGGNSRGPVSNVVGGVGGTVDRLTGGSGSGSVGGTVDRVVGGVQGTVDQATGGGPVGDTVDRVVDGVGGAVDGVTGGSGSGTVGGAVDRVVGGVGGTVDGAVGGGGVGGAVDRTLGGTRDAVAGLGGSRSGAGGAGGSLGGSDSGAGGSGSGGAGGGSGSGAGSSLGSGAVGAAAGGSATRGALGPGGRTRGGRRPSRAFERAAHRRVLTRRRERLVRRFRGCLDVLPPMQRTTLILRYGVGPLRARSGREAARLLDVSRARVRVLERRGLRKLVRLGGEATCAGTGVERATLVSVYELLTEAVTGGGAGIEAPLAAGVLFGDAGVVAPDPGEGEVAGARESGGERNGDEPAGGKEDGDVSSAGPSLGNPFGAAGSGLDSPLLLLFLAIVVACLVSAGREVRRALR